MNRDEAIKELQGWRSTAIFDGEKAQSMKEANPALDEALGLAIEALKTRNFGEWKVYKDCEGKQTQYTCPFCNLKEKYFAWKPKYCEECGARLYIPNTAAAEPCDNDCEHCDWATCPKEDI